MSVDDRERLNLHRKLEAVLGQPDADSLMAHLPPVTWNEVATKDDIRGSQVVLRTEIHAIAAELRGEMQVMGAELRGEMQAMGAELRGEMQAMGAELRGEMQAMGSGVRAEVSQAMERQIRWLVTFNTALVAVALAVARLLL